MNSRSRLHVATWVCVLTPVALSTQVFDAGRNVQSDASQRPRTKLVMLGTGNPSPKPDRSGPATVVLVDDVPYVIDCGPGLVRRWAEAVRVNRLKATVQDLRTVFITHLHTDHTLGYADLIFTPWTNQPGGRPGAARPLEVYGPEGLGAMTNHLIAAYAEDVRVRTSEGGSRNRAGGTGPVVNSHEIRPGVVYRDDRVTVNAFRVPHGNWEHAYGFRFRTPDKTIVISGDTAYSPVFAEQCAGCDILVHEGGFASDNSSYFKASHISAEELARVAVDAKPKLLVLYHQRDANEAGVRIIGSRFQGPVVVANDLQVFD
jgi:ribonuclease BN (tRNA processing enzyme)